MYNFNPYNVLLAITTNIPQRLKTESMSDALLPSPGYNRNLTVIFFAEIHFWHISSCRLHE